MRIVFKEKEQKAETIYSFTFLSKEDVRWIAGQAIRLEIETLWLTEERYFTISSAPYEKKITITTEVSDSDFKQALHALKSGDEIDAFAISGDHVWQNKPSIFVAGGMGITPYIAILKQLHYEGVKPEAIKLLYSAKEQKIVFKKELLKLEKELDNLSLELLHGQRIDEEKVLDAAKSINDPIIYISGPSKMVDSLGAKFEDKSYLLKRDWFTGL